MDPWMDAAHRGVTALAEQGQDMDGVAARIHESLHGLIDDEPAALAELQGDPSIGRTCATYKARHGVTLWDDFIGNAAGMCSVARSPCCGLT